MQAALHGGWSLVGPYRVLILSLDLHLTTLDIASKGLRRITIYYMPTTMPETYTIHL